MRMPPPPMPQGGAKHSLGAAAAAAAKKAAVNSTADAQRALRTYKQAEFDDLTAKISSGQASASDIFRLAEITVCCCSHLALCVRPLPSKTYMLHCLVVTQPSIER